MSDPNIAYREGYKALTRELGRLPTMRDKGLLALHEAYKKAWAPAEETVLPPNAAAGRPAPAGFSRQPAPQARSIDAREGQAAGPSTYAGASEPLSGPNKSAEQAGRRSEPDADTGDSRATEWPTCRWCRRPADGKRGGDDACSRHEDRASYERRIRAAGIIPEPESSPEPPSAAPRNYEGLCEGDRGPSGGLMCRCQACGRLWERAKVRGRPAYTCGECR